MPVHLAAHHDHLGCLELLLDCTPTERCYWRDKKTQGTPMHHAAAGGAVRCLRRLLKVENPDVTTKSGRTAVSLAAQAGSVSCLEALIDQAEADPQRADEDGMTPVHYAAQAGHLNCTHWLVRRARCSLNDSRKKDGATAMHLAAGKGRCPILQWALNRELSFGEELDVFGRTPVHYAAEEGQITVLRTFAKFPRVHLDVKDFLGRTPSNLAERRGHSACVRFLDACLQQRHPDGEGALFAKLTRSISSPGGLNNKLNRRNSNRRSGRRKHISSVYLEEKTLTDTESGSTRELPPTEEIATHIVSALISQVGMMSIAPVVPDVPLHRRIINNLVKKIKRQTSTEDFTVTL
ncbi:espin-like [Acanthaster planci]|uniref:Espin-like n=1 Tax=Acanthaster planci TaxID=133434 RepID=A0A8B7YII8_ACAPL|nr:espin-like [Acanthaster planci]XP_022092420.1 espin-like [Acanthaster planci]XP_022092421.1 espin-like [Acanthaster planci]XP_022092422.1 espin-like [Acanthaster planci]XP_022092423.1 espin-like [Acanthaster planci]